LSVSTPTANSMIKRLHEKEFVVYEKYKPIKLTEKGKKEAALIVRKHRLTEMFLVEKMGFGWEKVHAIAEQIEHIKSPIFFDKMDELLGYPNLDPHGSPIPNKEGKIESLQNSELKLSDCKEEDKIKRIDETTFVLVGSTSLSEVNEFFNLSITAKNQDFDTVGGYLLNEAGTIPKEKFSINIEDYKFTVLKIRKKRILKIRVEKMK